MKDIKKIFYESIVPEATIGKVKAYFCFGMVFNTRIDEINKNYETKLDNDDLVIPTLMIKDKEKFDNIINRSIFQVNKHLLFDYIFDIFRLLVP